MNKIIQWCRCAQAITLARPKEVGLLAFMIIFVVMGVYKSTPPMMDKVFELRIHKNKVAIKTVTQERDITQSKSVWVDKLNLKDGTRLYHPKLGVIGFADSFFVDIESSFKVKKEGVYYFIPGSDDGFSLELDGKRLCAFENDRPYATQRCKVELTKGLHNFKMSYFQGGGFAGLTLAYQFKGDKKQRWVGENSSYLSFD